MSDYVVQISEEFRQTWPESAVGVMILEQIANPISFPEFVNRKRALEMELRTKFHDAAELREHPTIQAYTAYYKNFKKTYHVLAQVESIAFNDGSLPNTTALVEAMFMSEVKNMLLTAGHDLDAIKMPVRIDVAQGVETYTTMSGGSRTLKPGDMYMADAQGVISSVIYGPDSRTRIQPHTRRAMFVVYAPQGISTSAIRDHLAEIRNLISLFAPQVETGFLDIFQ